MVVTHPIEPQDNIALFRLLGDLFDRRAQAQAPVSALERALAATRRLAETLPGRNVLYLIWQSPWMTVSRDTYITNMLALAGMRTIAHDPENRYPVIDDMAALLPQADQILFASEPFSFGDEHRRQFRADFAVRDTPRLRLVDGQMLSWYGSRAIRGLAYLRRLATETEG